MVPSRVLSRTNVADTSRRSAPNRRFFNALQPLKVSWLSFSESRPLFSITCSLFLQNTRGVGCPDPAFGSSAGVKDSRRRRSNYGTTLWCTSAHPPHAFASAVICATWRLYPLWSQSIAHTSRRHGGVPYELPIFPAFRCTLSQPLTRLSLLAALRCYHKLHET
jgi:hypothetical protein